MYNHAFTCTVCDWKSKPDISLLKCTKCHNPLKIEYFNENMMKNIEIIALRNLPEFTGDTDLVKEIAISANELSNLI